MATPEQFPSRKGSHQGSAENQNQNGSSASTEQQNRRAEELAASISQNGLIMDEIMSHVTNLKERHKLQLVSRSFNTISKRAEFKLKQSEKTIKMQFYDYETDITIQMGEHDGFNLTASCLTTDARRELEAHDENDIQMRRQPPVLINKMTNIFNRVSPYIEEFIVDGQGPNPDFFNNHILVITTDFLTALNGLQRLKSLKFSNCEFDEEAMDFLTSDEMSFHRNITKLSLENVQVYRGGNERELASLVTKELEEIEIKGIKLETLGAELIHRIEVDNLLFERMSLGIDKLDSVAIARNVLMRLYHFTKSMDLEFCSLNRDFGDLLSLATVIREMPTIRSLTVNIKCLQYEHNNRFSEIFEGIQQQRNLESLKIGGFTDDRLYDILSQVLVDCQKLKVLHIENKAGRITRKRIDELFRSFPKTLTELKLDRISVNKNMMDILCDKYAKSLTKLSITNSNSCFTYHSYIRITQTFTELNYLHINLPIPLEKVDYVLDLAKINEVILTLKRKPPVLMDTVLENNFQTMLKVRLPTFKYYLKMNGRKDTQRLPREKSFFTENSRETKRELVHDLPKYVRKNLSVSLCHSHIQ